MFARNTMSLHLSQEMPTHHEEASHNFRKKNFLFSALKWTSPRVVATKIKDIQGGVHAMGRGRR